MKKNTDNIFHDGKRSWHNRYYADLNKPCGYYDLAELSSLSHIPDEDQLFALTDEQWSQRMNGEYILCKAVINGVWQDYTQKQPIASQASVALRESQRHITNSFLFLGEPIPQAWIDYQKALISIVNGIDTTSTELPTRPPDAQ